MIGGRPIAMAIEQRADDAAIQYSGKSLILFLWFPFCYDFAVFRKTANMQTVRVRRPAAPAGIVRRVLFLKGLARSSLGCLARARSGGRALPSRSSRAVRRALPDTGASLARCKVSAAGSDDYYRVARSRARTSRQHATRRKIGVFNSGGKPSIQNTGAA